MVFKHGVLGTMPCNHPDASTTVQTKCNVALVHEYAFARASIVAN